MKFFKKEKSEQNIFTGDRSDYHWKKAADEYCKINERKRRNLSLSNVDEPGDSIIWEYAGNHIAFFLAWIVQNSFYNEEIFGEEEIKLLQNEKISGTDFLSDYCDNRLDREFMSREILDFVDYYYEKNYFHDYCNFIEKEMKETVLAIRFSWDMYHQFVPVLNYAYREYQKMYNISGR